jgi:hypothetical protein
MKLFTGSSEYLRESVRRKAQVVLPLITPNALQLAPCGSG